MKKEIVENLDKENGQNKCPRCGNTHFTFDLKTSNLICTYCKYRFKNELDSKFTSSIASVTSKITGMGINDIKNDNNYITFKCESCGSEVGFDTSSELQKVCPFCRSVLSINMQIDNGSIPDMVLPFKLSKEEISLKANLFLNKRKFFADSDFVKKQKDFVGIYLPYVIVDINASIRLYGQGERQTRMYISGFKHDKQIYYDADVYYVKREFDLEINDLTIEANSENLDYNNSHETNNIINSIMPFDTENCVKWEPSYLKGYTFEKRDLNIGELEKIVNLKISDVVRHATNDTLKPYNRGVYFKQRNQNVKGERWLIAYLPVYTFTYNKGKRHFIAVNGRSGEVMGSVPISVSKVSFVVLLLLLLIFGLVTIFNSYIFFSLIIFVFIFINKVINKYSNKNSRHKHEKETNIKVFNLVKEDIYIKSKHKLNNSSMLKANNNKVEDHEEILKDIS